MDSAGVVYVADTISDTIRKITAGGVVTTLAGFYGSLGAVDGIGLTARFAYPIGVAIDASGNIYVADRTNHTIRKVTPAGNVTTFAGLANNSGTTDGTGSAARFSNPQGIAVDSAGTVYVADGSNTIRTITPAGVVTTLAGLAFAKWQHRRNRQCRAIQQWPSRNCRRQRTGNAVCGGQQQSHDPENCTRRRRDDARGPGGKHAEAPTERAAPRDSIFLEEWRSTLRARCMSPTPATTRSGRLHPPAW